MLCGGGKIKERKGEKMEFVIIYHPSQILKKKKKKLKIKKKNIKKKKQKKNFLHK